MKQYNVEVREIHIQNYKVEADSAEKAKKIASMGGEAIFHEYSHAFDSYKKLQKLSCEYVNNITIIEENAIINLPCYGIIIKTYGSDSIDSFIVSARTHRLSTIESSQLDDENFDGILSLILAHACAGIDVTIPAYLEGIETAVQAVENNY